MAEPRISNILIGVLFVGLFALAIAIFVGKGVSDYAVNGYNNTTLQLMVDNVEDINTITNETSGKLGTAGASGDADRDIFGSFFLKAWQSMKTLGKSIKIFFQMISSGVSQIPFISGAFSSLLTAVLTGSVVIIIVIAIFFHFIKPSNRL
jgi:hypothetical protein